MQFDVNFSSGKVTYLLHEPFAKIRNLANGRKIYVITDNHIAGLYPEIVAAFSSVVIPSGEQHKHLHTVEYIVTRLLALEATRGAFLVGMGGGVVTDITGFVASVYMRGVGFGLVPTTLLGMVDASIGGKNGVNVGMNKNIAGTITQPECILVDSTFLATLPDGEWSNGFAEIIKYGCLFDKMLIETLHQHDINYYKNNMHALNNVIAQCVAYKNNIVATDEKETGIRKFLNFGHTVAHAIENLYHLPHGAAVAIGMVIACRISEKVNELPTSCTQVLTELLHKYQLPAAMAVDNVKTMALLKMDKKRVDNTIDYITLRDFGDAVIRSLPFETVEKAL